MFVCLDVFSEAGRIGVPFVATGDFAIVGLVDRVGPGVLEAIARVGICFATTLLTKK